MNHDLANSRRSQTKLESARPFTNYTETVYAPAAGSLSPMPDLANGTSGSVDRRRTAITLPALAAFASYVIKKSSTAARTRCGTFNVD
jgi:hypothetical protein